MGVLKLDAWHSKHAGQTVDDAIDGYRQIAEIINDINNRMIAAEMMLDEHALLIREKYDKAGGDITVNDLNHIVNITSKTSLDYSQLKVRYIEGATPRKSTEKNGVLYLNKNSTGKIYLGKGGAYIDEKGRVYGAVWNDLAEYRNSDIQEPGRVICENGDGTLSLSYKRLQPGATIISDTFGFSIGETESCKTPVAIAGRVLAHTYEDWWTFEPGEAVCSGPNGTVSKMTRREIRKYPERIIGTVSELPTYEYWGENKIPVNNRIWINIK